MKDNSYHWLLLSMHSLSTPPFWLYVGRCIYLWKIFLTSVRLYPCMVYTLYFQLYVHGLVYLLMKNSSYHWLRIYAESTTLYFWLYVYTVDWCIFLWRYFLALAANVHAQSTLYFWLYVDRVSSCERYFPPLATFSKVSLHFIFLVTRRLLYLHMKEISYPWLLVSIQSILYI